MSSKDSGITIENLPYRKAIQDSQANTEGFCIIDVFETDIYNSNTTALPLVIARRRTSTSFAESSGTNNSTWNSLYHFITPQQNVY